MFDYLEAEAYHKLRGEIMVLVETVLEENTEDNDYFSGKARALCEVLDRMNAIDSALHEAIVRESEKEAAYYEAERSADDSSYEQQ